MRRVALAASVALFAAVPASADASNPIAKVIQLITDLEAKIIKEGEEASKVYAEFSEWCEDRARNVGFEIKTGKSQVEELQAAIESATAEAGAAGSKIEELAASITADENDLKSATAIRAKETEDFAAEEKDLVETIDTIERAIGILEREMRKGGKAMLQFKNTNNVVKAFSAMVDASMLNTDDAQRLTALVQQQNKDEDGDDQPMGAPAAAAYEQKSGGIIETLEDLLDKAKDQLESARKKEVNSRHNFEMLEQSLKDELKNAKEEMDEARTRKAASADAKATAQGELGVTTKALKEDMETKESLRRDCMSKSQDFEASTKSRAEELKALAEAKKAISENTEGAQANTYGAASFLQLNGGNAMTTSADLANFEAVQLVRNLARQQHSTELALLAKRMAAAIRAGTASGADPFAKVKDLIKGMIEKLLKAGDADASHKAYCDKEMAETTAKLESKTAAKEKLETEIDSMTAKSAQLKADVAGLQKALSELLASQGSMDKIRSEEKEVYKKAKAENQQGLQAVKMALKILHEYYSKEAAHQTAEGAANGIIGMLEVAESDLTKSVAEMNIEEQTAQSEYERQTSENKISKATKEQSVKYKTKELKSLAVRLSDAGSDRQSVIAELQAVQEYDARIKETCVAKPETFSERKARRQAEIDGLKEALNILKGESVLLQSRTVALRGRRSLVAKVHRHA